MFLRVSAVNHFLLFSKPLSTLKKFKMDDAKVCESSVDGCRRLNVTDVTREDVPDSGGSIRKITLSEFASSDVGCAENSWIRGGTELSRRRADREKT